MEKALSIIRKVTNIALLVGLLSSLVASVLFHFNNEEGKAIYQILLALLMLIMYLTDRLTEGME